MTPPEGLSRAVPETRCSNPRSFRVQILTAGRPTAVRGSHAQVACEWRIKVVGALAVLLCKWKALDPIMIHTRLAIATTVRVELLLKGMFHQQHP